MFFQNDDSQRRRVLVWVGQLRSQLTEVQLLLNDRDFPTKGEVSREAGPETAKEIGKVWKMTLDVLQAISKPGLIVPPNTRPPWGKDSLPF